MPGNDRRAELELGAAETFGGVSVDSTCPAGLRAAEKAADIALRCAWLRYHADELAAFDQSGQLFAQLRDFADLLECAESRGWFA